MMEWVLGVGVEEEEEEEEEHSNNSFLLLLICLTKCLLVFALRDERSARSSEASVGDINKNKTLPILIFDA
jgi:hypothetical protein